MDEDLIIRSSSKHALIFGASGLVGAHCIRNLLAHPAYDRVTAFSRRPLQVEHPKLTTVLVDFEEIPIWADQIAGDDIYICLGTTLKQAGSKQSFYHIEYDYIDQICSIGSHHGVKQLLLVSAMGANADSVFFYNQVKGLIEDNVKRKNFWAVHLFRPSVLIGAREEVRPLESLAAGAGMALRVLGPKLFANITPIESEKVAHCMVESAQGTRSGVFFYPSSVIARLGKKNNG